MQGSALSAYSWVGGHGVRPFWLTTYRTSLYMTTPFGCEIAVW